METMERNKPRRRRSFAPEFKAEIVEHRQRGDRTISRVARAGDLTESAARSWVDQVRIDAGEKAGLTTNERGELPRLRQENRQLRLDNADGRFKW